ncbi:MAG: hypothetical protein R3D02_05050 [Hyphomicrobiales bacterium]
MKRLIGAMGVTRDEVAEPHQCPDAASARLRLVSRRCAINDRSRWSADESRLGDAARLAGAEGIALMEARTEAEEALAIALRPGEAIEAPDARAALVTPDRALARRVAVELARWHVAVDDSAGRPPTGLPAAVLARLVAEVATGDAEPVAVLAPSSIRSPALARTGRGRGGRRMRSNSRCCATAGPGPAPGALPTALPRSAPPSRPA